MKNIAIIPARSGSKGVKDKNIRLLCGKPLLAYSIEAAFNSKQFDTVMVSTDSEEYAGIAKGYGAEVPFLRSRINSMDISTSWDAVSEVLRTYESEKQNFDTFCLLQPTSPLRSADDLRNAYNLYREKEAIAVVSVCEVEHSPLWCGALSDSKSLDGFIKRENNLQRQRLETYYRLNGAVYIVDVKEFQKDRFLYRDGGYAYIMSRENSIDIDTELDFEYAEFIMKKRNKF